MKDCVFCDIAQGKARAKIVLETDDYIVLENINPQAPVHVLVMPKKHIEKEDAIKGKISGFWDEMIRVTNKVIKRLELDKTGYRLVSNGAGYHEISHEHIHILGGKGWRPDDNL